MAYFEEMGRHAPGPSLPVWDVGGRFDGQPLVRGHLARDPPPHRTSPLRPRQSISGSSAPSQAARQACRSIRRSPPPTPGCKTSTEPPSQCPACGRLGCIRWVPPLTASPTITAPFATLCAGPPHRKLSYFFFTQKARPKRSEIPGF